MVTSAPIGICCACHEEIHHPKFVVVTGGPGAGKTAVLELVRKVLCPHVTVLPEAASILFSGGFWRRDTVPARAAAQRAIYHVQRELEQIVADEMKTAVGLCDRGSIDGLAYWPKDEASYWRELGTDCEAEYARYVAVIHLRTPRTGYNHENPVRIENAAEALLIDEKLLKVWEGHPNRIIIESHDDFLKKADKAIARIKGFIPECCLPRGAREASSS